MSSDYFYCDDAILRDSRAAKLVDAFQQYAESVESRVYLLYAPLEFRDSYDYSGCVVIAVPNRRIAFICLDSDGGRIEIFRDDFLEDVGILSSKYGYVRKLGRPRKWKDEAFVTLSLGSNIGEGFIEEYLRETELSDTNAQRKTWFLISLLIGSINDIDGLDVEAAGNILDYVKQKIVLFDGQQSRFLYENLNQKRIVIQGMAGTGKTELLLHKLRELYTHHPNGKRYTIFFTCYNRVLANKMRQRVTSFFNYMKVDEQIEWGTRLHVARSWGSKSDPESGLYSYICSVYGVHFRNFRESSFDAACRYALQEIPQDAPPCLDYILVDESQDFPGSFFDLCERVARFRVYIAGDIFQDIYEERSSEELKVDYLLNNCYRTDPKTLLFAHALGLGLCENPVIQWLDNDMWRNCGYVLKDHGSDVSIRRKPINRFGLVGNESLPEAIAVRSAQSFAEDILAIINEVRQVHRNVEPGDIAIVFPGNTSMNYEIANEVADLLRRRLNWGAVLGYNAKSTVENSVFISNRNNIKGLEFPFVICYVIGEITRSLALRNALYMILTRSFLTSYLVFNESCPGPIGGYVDLAERLKGHNDIVVRKPSDDEIAQQKELVTMKLAERPARSFEAIVEECLVQEGFTGSEIDDMKSRLLAFYGDDLPNGDYEALRERAMGAISLWQRR